MDVLSLLASFGDDLGLGAHETLVPDPVLTDGTKTVPLVLHGLHCPRVRPHLAVRNRARDTRIESEWVCYGLDFLPMRLIRWSHWHNGDDFLV